MKKAKRLAVIAAVLLMLISGAITVYAMTGEQGKAPQTAGRQETVLADYAIEEMAVGTYYENWVPELSADEA